MVPISATTLVPVLVAVNVHWFAAALPPETIFLSVSRGMGLGVVAHALTLAVSPPTVMLAALYKPLPEEPVHVLAALVPLTVKVTDTR